MKKSGSVETEWLTKVEAKEALACGTKGLERLIHTGALTTLRYGDGRTKIGRASVEALLVRSISPAKEA